MSAPLEADCHEIHETAATSKGDTELFSCKGSGADGVGEYTTDGFVVRQPQQGRRGADGPLSQRLGRMEGPPNITNRWPWVARAQSADRRKAKAKPRTA
jgi:hypothetical protein